MSAVRVHGRRRILEARSLNLSPPRSCPNAVRRDSVAIVPDRVPVVPTLFLRPLLPTVEGIIVARIRASFRAVIASVGDAVR